MLFQSLREVPVETHRSDVTYFGSERFTLFWGII